jgi:ribosome assembly protein 1
MANPMLEFYKWNMINTDPFYIPLSKEDIELHGTIVDTPNIAKKIINSVRMRKGLTVDEKIVKDANKQANLGKNK